jgi:hypothetical protein
MGKRNNNTIEVCRLPFLSLLGLSIIRTNISGEGKIFQNAINHTKNVGKCIVKGHSKV